MPPAVQPHFAGKQGRLIRNASSASMADGMPVHRVRRRRTNTVGSPNPNAPFRCPFGTGKARTLAQAWKTGVSACLSGCLTTGMWNVGCGENSPAIHRWESRPVGNKVPQGTAERFFRPLRDFRLISAPFPSAEALGYFRNLPIASHCQVTRYAGVFRGFSRAGTQNRQKVPLFGRSQRQSP